MFSFFHCLSLEEETGKVESQKLNRLRNVNVLASREDPNQTCFWSVFLLEIHVGKPLIRDVQQLFACKALGDL